MNYKLISATLALCSISFCGHATTPPNKRPVEPGDCVTVRYLLHDDVFENAIQINKQGTRVAYLVRTPDLATNHNRIDLYVLGVSHGPSTQMAPLMSAVGLSQVRWLGDGEHLTVLKRGDAKSSIFDINVTTGLRRELAHIASDVQEFSIDEAGHTLIYAAEARMKSQPSHSPEEIDFGYRISFQKNVVDELPHSRVFALTRHGNRWSRPRAVEIQSPLSQTPINDFAHYRVYPLNLSLSPNGRFLILSYFEHIPAVMEASSVNPYINLLKQRGTSLTQVTICVDMITRATSWPLKAPLVQSLPLWSSDSHFFIANATSPIGSQWELQDRQRAGSGYGMHVFSVEPETELVQEVTGHDATQSIRALQPLYITPEHNIVVRTSANTIQTFAKNSQTWEVASEIHLPFDGVYGHGQLASNSRDVIGEYQNASTPPELFRWPTSSGDLEIVTNLNPQFHDLNLIAPEHVSWQISDGYTIHGALFLPPGEGTTKAYPLVIGTHPYLGQFVCDSGADHFPSFPPQPLTNAGIAYLARELSDDLPSPQDDQKHMPHEYPGGIGEAAFHMNIWDSAVRTLARQGIVDLNRVGIIGFSRTGWYTEFILTHSEIPYRAATVTDNVEYSLGEYWLQHSGDVINGWDAMYGGPPFGETLANWQKYAISFNVDKVHTPLLMEEMGYGAAYDTPRLIPAILASHFELFTGLERLHRPVEMYFYPTEVHQLETPRARLASLQRNFDWYRFWLLGQERPNPADADQFKGRERPR